VRKLKVDRTWNLCQLCGISLTNGWVIINISSKCFLVLR